MVQEGLLWFDDDPVRSLADKVGRAARRYELKYGRAPNVCYVHPTMIDNREARVDALRVLPARTVLPNHFWVGVQEGRG